MELTVDPPRGVGPLLIGMPFEDAERTLRSLPGYVAPAPGESRNAGFAHYESEMSITVEADRSGAVKAVEVYRPQRDDTLVYQGISLLSEPAIDVIRRLAGVAEIDVEDDGLRVLAPDLLLSLWRATLPEGPHDEDGKYFESVLVAAPGYYD